MRLIFIGSVVKGTPLLHFCERLHQGACPKILGTKRSRNDCLEIGKSGCYKSTPRNTQRSFPSYRFDIRVCHTSCAICEFSRLYDKEIAASSSE